MAEHYTSSFIRRDKSGKGWRMCLKYKEGEAWKTTSKKAAATGKRAAQKEAEDWRYEMNAEYEAGVHSGLSYKGADITVAQYVRSYIDMRAADVKRPITPETVADYERSLDVIADPAGGIADIELRSLTYDDVDAWETWMLSPNGKGHVPSTAIKRHNILKAALRQAVVDKLIPYNPMEGMKRPQDRRKRKINALMPDSMARVRYWIEDTEPTAFAAAVAMGYFIGMRRQECAGLKWEDVDFNNGIMRLCRAVGKPKGGERLKDLKNHEARIVPLTAPLRRALSRRRARMQSDMAAVDLDMQIEDLFVCGEITGGFGNMDAITKQWKMLRELLKLEGVWSKRVVFHDLRHSFASYAISAKTMDILTVAHILGHSDKSVTLNWYSTALPTALIEAAPNIASALDVGNLEVPQYLLPGDF